MSPDKLKTNGLWVSVSWSGVSSPNESDWIGVYLPHSREGIDPGKQAPVKYQVWNQFMNLVLHSNNIQPTNGKGLDSLSRHSICRYPIILLQ